MGCYLLKQTCFFILSLYLKINSLAQMCSVAMRQLVVSPAPVLPSEIFVAYWASAGILRHVYAHRNGTDDVRLQSIPLLSSLLTLLESS